MAVYLARYLNVPTARLPGEDDNRVDDLPTEIEEIRFALLESFDRQRQVVWPADWSRAILCLATRRMR